MENKYKCLEVDDSEIYRLRYQVYVQEKKFIDKDNKKFIKDNMVTDDIDKVSHQFGVYYEDKLVATARYNCNVNSQIETLKYFPEYNENYLKSLSNTKKDHLVLIEITRIALDINFRNSYASVILFFTIFEHALKKYAVDGMVLKLREREKQLENLYLNFGCKILDESSKLINIYGSGDGDIYRYGYMLLSEFPEDLSNLKACKVLGRICDGYYKEKVDKVLERIRSYNGYTQC